MSLLFEAGARPNVADIRALAEGSAGFATGEDEAGESCWLELLANGLAFDLQRLAPGQPRTLPGFLYQYDLPGNFDPTAYEAVTLEPGPHLEGGESLPPVVRSQMALGVGLCALPGIAAVGWEPARALNSPAHFCRSVTRWLEGGVFPALGLTALAEQPGGAMHTEGLGFFIGQELEIAPELAGDKVAAARLALRLVHELVEAGGIVATEGATGPDGERLLLDVLEEGRLIRVRKA